MPWKAISTLIAVSYYGGQAMTISADSLNCVPFSLVEVSLEVFKKEGRIIFLSAFIQQ